MANTGTLTGADAYAAASVLRKAGCQAIIDDPSLALDASKFDFKLTGGSGLDTIEIKIPESHPAATLFRAAEFLTDNSHA